MGEGGSGSTEVGFGFPGAGRVTRKWRELGTEELGLGASVCASERASVREGVAVGARVRGSEGVEGARVWRVDQRSAPGTLKA